MIRAMAVVARKMQIPREEVTSSALVTGTGSVDDNPELPNDRRRNFLGVSIALVTTTRGAR
jgi:hypothetical protein